jgi:hypothetical protein
LAGRQVVAAAATGNALAVRAVRWPYRREIIKRDGRPGAPVNSMKPGATRTHAVDVSRPLPTDQSMSNPTAHVLFKKLETSTDLL